jgi:hypothetical protein
MTDQEWLDRRAKEINPDEIAEKKRLLRKDFIDNAKYYCTRGKSKWISNDYHLIPNIGLSVGTYCNYNARLYYMYGLQELIIKISLCFLKFKQEWSFKISKLHPDMRKSIGDGGAF